MLLGMNERYEYCLIGDAVYPQRAEEGLVITLLKHHTAREAEALLVAIMDDKTEAKAVLKRVRGLIRATA